MRLDEAFHCDRRAEGESKTRVRTEEKINVRLKELRGQLKKQETQSKEHGRETGANRPMPGIKVRQRLEGEIAVAGRYSMPLTRAKNWGSIQSMLLMTFSSTLPLRSMM